MNALTQPKSRRGQKNAGADNQQGKDAKADNQDAKSQNQDDGENASVDGFTEEQVQKMIGKSVAASFDSELPKHLKGLVTEDSLKTIIAAEFKKQAKDSTVIKADELKLVAEASIKAQMDSMRRDKKFVQNPDDADGSRAADDGGDNKSLRDAGRSRIEIPCSLTKGNLPLHMKQLMNVLLHKNIDDGVTDSQKAEGQNHEDSLFNGIKTRGAKALTSTGDGTGSEFVPRNLSSELYRRMYLVSQLAQAFMAQEIDMPSDPYDLPLVTVRPTFYLNSTQNTLQTTSNPTTAKITLQTVRLVAKVQYSYEANEDSIIPILPLLETLLSESGAYALENAIINGDTTSTHQDSDITAANDQAKAWKGLRKLALANAQTKSDWSTGGISRSNMLALPKLMLKWGANTQNLVWVVGTKGNTSLLNLDEVALAYARGSAGTYTQGGPAPAPWGGQIVVSEAARENLNASGVFDNTTTTKGAIIAFNKGAFLFGSRRQFTIEVARNIDSMTNDIVASFRKAFQPVETPSATVPSVAIGYNYNS